MASHLLVLARWRLLCSLSFLSILLCFLFYQHRPELNHDISIDEASRFVDTKYPFQTELSALEYPRRNNLQDYKNRKPHNLIAGSQQQQTFATLLCTRNASIHDPYFAATLNLVYRNLWSLKIASKTRPFTVFVAPFVTQEQRDILAGAGAVIQELGLLPWQPNIDGVFDRWRDQFSKLHLFGQTQYSTIAFMDSDAFPIANIDSVFNEVSVQTCDVNKLNAHDAKDKEALCEYGFAGVENFKDQGGVNGGFLVITPNAAMHRKMLRNYVQTDKYDVTMVEQNFLAWQFSLDGAFPYQTLPRKYNAFFPVAEDEGYVNVVHEKLWALNGDSPAWLRGVWDDGWKEMIDFFDSPAFVQARMLDDLQSAAQDTHDALM